MELHDETVSKEKQQQKEAKDKVMQHSADTFGMENCGRWEKRNILGTTTVIFFGAGGI